MPRCPHCELIVQEGAEITKEPKPPWWRPLQRAAWRKRCEDALIAEWVKQSMRDR